MACSGDKAPLNLSMTMTNTLQRCDVTCSYHFSYGISKCLVTPNGNFLSYKYDGKSVVTYNATDIGSKYKVQEIRIYSPPLTKYTGDAGANDAKAELFIHHINTDTGKNLLVCVPIAVNDSASKSSDLLAQLITSGIDNTGGEQEINVSNFTLNALIPITEYYQYSGNLPYSQTGNDVCQNTTADIIIFPADGAINMKSKTLNILTSLITGIEPTEFTIQDPKDVSLRYNEKGTTNNFGSGGEDIYIECNPVGDDGEDIGDGKDGKNLLGDEKKYEKGYLSKKTKKKLIEFLIYTSLFIVMVVIIYFGHRFVMSWLKSISTERVEPSGG